MQLAEMIHEGVRLLTTMGFNILGTMGDGATENRKFQWLCSRENKLIDVFLKGHMYSKAAPHLECK